MSETTYRFEVEKQKLGRNQNKPPTSALIFAGERVVASVQRFRKTIRSKWEIRVSIVSDYNSLPIPEFRAHCEAIATMALHPWGDA